jgi:curved DNA-binding protein CbpA
LFFFRPLLNDIAGKSKAENNKNSENKSANIDDPWQLLGVKPGANMKEIKAAYYEKIRQYHPDMVDKMGPEIQQVARDKSQKLNQAFEYLKNKYSEKETKTE